MTANAVIETIESLPQSERAKVVAYVRGLNLGPSPVVPADPAAATDPAFHAASDRVFSRHKKLFELLAQ